MAISQPCIHKLVSDVTSLSTVKIGAEISLLYMEGDPIIRVKMSVNFSEGRGMQQEKFLVTTHKFVFWEALREKKKGLTGGIPESGMREIRDLRDPERRSCLLSSGARMDLFLKFRTYADVSFQRRSIMVAVKEIVCAPGGRNAAWLLSLRTGTGRSPVGRFVTCRRWWEL